MGVIHFNFEDDKLMVVPAVLDQSRRDGWPEILRCDKPPWQAHMNLYMHGSLRLMFTLH